MNRGVFLLEVKIKFFKEVLNFLLIFIPTNNLGILKLSRKLDKYISKYQKLKFTKKYEGRNLVA